MAVSVHFDPSRARPLATYMSIVVRLAREVPGQAWQRYNRLFRQAAVVNPALAWDRQEPDIWLAATVEHPHPIQSSSGGSRTQGLEAETEICRRFNRGDCYLSSCKFRHLRVSAGLAATPHGNALCCFIHLPDALHLGTNVSRGAISCFSDCCTCIGYVF